MKDKELIQALGSTLTRLYTDLAVIQVDDDMGGALAIMLAELGNYGLTFVLNVELDMEAYGDEVEIVYRSPHPERIFGVNICTIDSMKIDEPPLLQFISMDEIIREIGLHNDAQIMQSIKAVAESVERDWRNGVEPDFGVLFDEHIAPVLGCDKCDKGEEVKQNCKNTMVTFLKEDYEETFGSITPTDLGATAPGADEYLH